MIKEVLQAVLTQEQRDAGLYLSELDDHTVGLFGKDGRQFAVWNSTKVTVKEIKEEAENAERILAFDIMKKLDEISTDVGDIRNLKVPKCPACGTSGKELLIGYTEHGTMAFDGKEWLQSEQGADAEYYCLNCGYKFDYEELEKLGLF